MKTQLTAEESAKLIELGVSPERASESKSSVAYGNGARGIMKVPETPIFTLSDLVYKAWLSMLNRCYANHQKYPTYVDCSVCNDWLIYSNFKRWFENPENGYREGYALDKDILVKGNKTYSPTTCCFVPPYINSLLVNGSHRCGKYPKGVLRCKSGRFRAYHQRKSLGMFDTPEEAFYKYKSCRESHIKEIAQKAYNNNEILLPVFNALMKYNIDITD
ncbi:hypothetical protein [Muribaculum intestinale]|uniref:hypothetical protein n=1 Tax=Muribaculum intestinale TaxID=1796646 RepID=UPI00272C30FB|nr:hypothetical protein [Muribaculum intestinale]